MNIWAITILFALFGGSNIVCFWLGAKIGQKVSRGETIETPNLNPMERIRQHQERKEAEREKDKIETILRNIDNYNGTANGQKDVPRG